MKESVPIDFGRRAHAVSVPGLVLSLSAAAADQPAQMLDIARWQGQIVYVDFWASWCAPDCCHFLLTSACSSLGVKPWERSDLARPDMAASEQALTESLEDHTDFSKEAASGGRSFGGGGGGCGCH